MSYRKPSKEILQFLANNIKRKRLKKGWTPKQLAKVIGWHAVNVYKVERGARSNPDLATLEAFSNALGCETFELVARYYERNDGVAFPLEKADT